MPESRELVSFTSRMFVSSSRQRRRLSPLARDILIALLIKAIVLYGLWYAFFRMPIAPGMKMDTLVVEQRLIAPATTSEPAHGR